MYRPPLIQRSPDVAPSRSARRRCAAGLTEDVYLTVLELPEAPAAPITLRVIVQPLVIWLWIGGGVMALRHAPGRVPRSAPNPIDPVSAPVAGARPAAGPPAPEREPEPEAAPGSADDGPRPAVELGGGALPIGSGEDGRPRRPARVAPPS